MTRNDENNELYHTGVIGMKWGVRRYQNPDGSLTAKGRKRQARLKRAEDRKKQVKEAIDRKRAGKKELKAINKLKKKDPSKMTTDELNTLKNRIELEDRVYSSKTKVRKSKALSGALPTRILRSAIDDVVTPTLKETGKKLLSDKIKSAVSNKDKKSGDNEQSDEKLVEALEEFVKKYRS